MANESTVLLNENNGQGESACERLVAMLCSEVQGFAENESLRSRVSAIFEDHCLEEAAKTTDAPKPKF
ncbi:MAG: hypothetical protein CTY35_01840 [Methylotenera sp.]|uniref:hypothetical protein n=1 Tax=Methylotenera sp. TaxID=2051956 RepID=UPI000D475B87|nr:hypothetical protein [Methylotenera sp.]PPC84372.1 MAG: hypothetical protein CTY38_02060 [Methylotenera sp.]PPD01014.1 MAG: hypothetical protein CTY35_01840 [Methylotenera sp.]